MQAVIDSAVVLHARRFHGKPTSNPIAALSARGCDSKGGWFELSDLMRMEVRLHGSPRTVRSGCGEKLNQSLAPRVRPGNLSHCWAASAALIWLTIS